ncbi:glycoside hydrolase family 43 protein [Xylaria nigripes]|nr:glycoside hydrolase family 43 protein [Xylaria nigripes]
MPIMKGISLLLVSTARLVVGLPAKGEYFPTIGLTNITRLGRTDSNGIGGRSLSGPALGVDFPDPSIIYGDGSWKAYATSSNNKRVPIATSSDAASWSLTSHDALPDPGPWVDPMDKSIWAPDVQINDAGTYVMYYTAHQNGGTHCIGAATSSTAVGPYKPQRQPIICDQANGGVIDASGYDDGVDRWIVWKVDGNNLGGATTCQGGIPSGSYKPTPIKIQRMARDALTLLDSPSQILDNEGRSNDGVVEAPVLYKLGDGNFVLFYSAHCYSSDDYDIEYAFSNRINGAYTNRGILLRTADNKGIWAPGGLDIDPNGHSVVFHGRLQPGGEGARELFSAEISFSGHSANFRA